MYLSIIIVSYNTKELLRKCLVSILNTKLDVEIIVVDNASADGSAAMVEKEFKNVQLVKDDKNYGFSKANNIGVKKSKGKTVLFLNPDTVVNKEALLKTYEFLYSSEKIGIVTCRVNLQNGNLDDACHRGFPTPWNSFCYFSGLSKIFPKTKLFGGYNQTWKDLDSVHEIDSCAGAFMMVKRKVGEQIGWWDEDYFWYGEDLDLCYRVKEKGWQVWYCPEVSIVHYKGVSSGIKKTSQNITQASKETRILATKARFEAMRIFYKKHYEGNYPWVVTRAVYKAIDVFNTASTILQCYIIRT